MKTFAGYSFVKVEHGNAKTYRSNKLYTNEKEDLPLIVAEILSDVYQCLLRVGGSNEEVQKVCKEIELKMLSVWNTKQYIRYEFVPVEGIRKFGYSVIADTESLTLRLNEDYVEPEWVIFKLYT